MPLKTFLIKFWKSITVVAGILYLSFAPPSNFDKIPTFEYLDKVIHFFMYAGLTVVLIFDYQKATKQKTGLIAFILVCLLFPALLGGLIEILQGMFFAPRTAEWNDFLCNVSEFLQAGL
jgi:VanZ family protein